MTSLKSATWLFLHCKKCLLQMSKVTGAGAGEELHPWQKTRGRPEDEIKGDGGSIDTQRLRD